MKNPPPKEEEFFEQLMIETPIEISVRSTAMSVAKLRQEVIKHCCGELVAESTDSSFSRYFKRGCKQFRSLHSELRDFNREIVKLGPFGIPAMLFSKLGPALQWTFKDIRRYLLDCNCDDEPVTAAKLAFENYKANCRPETQSDGVNERNFPEVQNALFTKLETCGFRLAAAIEAADERRAAERERKNGVASLSRKHLLASGKGYSHFQQIGQEYKGVKVLDTTTLVLYGNVIDITAQGTWNFLDACLAAHFADKHFEVKLSNLQNLTTTDEKKLKTFIHRETIEESGQKRVGNCKYTGFAWFQEP